MPYVFGRVARDGRDSIFSVSRNILIVLLLVSVILTLIIYLTANLLILTFTGTYFAPSIQVLQILSFTFPFIAINQALGLYTMLPLRLDISFVASVLLGECVSLVLTYLVAPSFGAVGAASCRVLEAGITALAIALVLYNKKYMQKLLLPKANSSTGLVLPPIPLQ
jgi:O-antigen/teichoic acid export membrane protein